MKNTQIGVSLYLASFALYCHIMAPKGAYIIENYDACVGALTTSYAQKS